MKIIYNNLIPLKNFAALNFFGILLVRNEVHLTEQMINHELIHTAQMKEQLYLFFYIFYLIEWALKLFKYGSKSYYNISFEREAYENDDNLDYLKNRKRWAFLHYITSQKQSD